MLPSYAGKLKAVEELVTIIQDLRRQGKVVVLTNGCFDLLHHGHVRYLDQAKTLGDVLIVAVNSDTSVRTLKGPGRPVVPQGERVEVLAALASVDYVTIFDALTPEGVIQALTPDVLVKGGDWGADQIVGRQIVEGLGGKVLSLPYVEGASTSRLLRKIREGGG